MLTGPLTFQRRLLVRIMVDIAQLNQMSRLKVKVPNKKKTKSNEMRRVDADYITFPPELNKEK